MNAITAEAAPQTRESVEKTLWQVRNRSRDIVAPLTPEDMTVQSMDDASPAKWHLAHTTWFFETFVLTPHLAGYRVFDPAFAYCFNSYYESAGPRHARPRRGLLTRPSAQQVLAYRDHVDEALRALLAQGGAEAPGMRDLLALGCAHEQQHQELMLTDVLSLFAANPLRPAYDARAPERAPSAGEAQWLGFDGGVHLVGWNGEGFAFDNEGPQHEALVHPFRLADRLVTNAEWLAFMADGGYAKPILWLSDGWSCVQREGWRAPLYFEETQDGWAQMSLNGLTPVDPDAPVRHVSYYEADAFARWAGVRLPSEFEWEVAARSGAPLRQLYGFVWQWTRSGYEAYPGYRAPEGALGEYNGKFMVSQQTLRGSSCATPEGHSRVTYRNFFYPWQRWQFLGLRLADDAR